MANKKPKLEKNDLYHALKGKKMPNNYTGKGPAGLKKSKHSAFGNGDMGICGGNSN